jgi:hypothetical protein
MFYRPDDRKTRSLAIVAYWEQGFYVWVVWNGEDGARGRSGLCIFDVPGKSRIESFL